MTDEEWRTIPDTDGLYQVSDLGRVRSRRRRSGHMLPDGEWRDCAISGQSSGYLSVCVNGKQHLLHNLILETFVGPRPEGMVGRHFPDPDKNINRPDNLRWGPPVSNSQDTVLTTGVANQVLTPEQVLQIKGQLGTGPLTKQLLEEVSQRWPQVSKKTIGNIKYGACWGWLEDRLGE